VATPSKQMAVLAHVAKDRPIEGIMSPFPQLQRGKENAQRPTSSWKINDPPSSPHSEWSDAEVAKNVQTTQAIHTKRCCEYAAKQIHI
jgi:hypothetical protein